MRYYSMDAIDYTVSTAKRDIEIFLRNGEEVDLASITAHRTIKYLIRKHSDKRWSEYHRGIINDYIKQFREIESHILNEGY